jgi:hypothetical protein
MMATVGPDASCAQPVTASKAKTKHPDLRMVQVYACARQDPSALAAAAVDGGFSEADSQRSSSVRGTNVH